MGEDGKDSSKIEPFHNLNEKSYHKIMETASLSFKQPDPLGNVLSSEISKTTENGHEMKANVPPQKMVMGKTKVKKKMRVEDIITNLTKKVKQVANTPPKENEVKKVESMPTKDNKVKKVGSTLANENEVKKVGSMPPKDNKVKKVGSTLANENEVKKVGSMPPKDNKVKKVGSTLAKENEMKKVGSTLAKDNEVKKVKSTLAKDNEVKKVKSTSAKDSEVKKVKSTPAKDSEVKKVKSTPPKKNEVKQQVGHTPTKENGSMPANDNYLSSSGETQEDDVSSFASMCTIRNNLPEYTDLSELPPLTKQITKISPGNVVPKIIQTTPAISNPPNPVRQVILQTVPQRTNQQTPIILNKLPPGFIIRSDLPSSSFPNLQTTSTSGQPTLLLITKSGGPIYLTQNRNTSTNQTQAKPVNKANTSPVFTQTKPIISSSNPSTLLKGKAINSSKSILKLTSPSKTNAETPLITVQYNLPYPNNNCKVVNNPVNMRTAQNSQPGTFHTLGNIAGTNKVLVTELPRPSRPREMVVNFAGNQTAHITTMTDETSVIPEKQKRFIPSFLYGSPPDTTAIKKTKPSPVAEKQNGKTFFIVTSPSAAATNAKQKINPNNKVAVQSTQRKSIYDEKIAQLTSKMININQAVAVNGKATTLSNVLQKKSNVVINNVRVSNRKRQQTERAKLFEKETKKRKKNDEKSPRKEEAKLDVKVKVEKPDYYNITSPKVVSPSKHQSISQTLNKSPSKTTKTVPQQTLVKNDAVPVKVKEDDPGSLFRDPALLTREERALQRALMMFKELEEKQARKESVSDTERTSSRKSGRTIQLNKTSDVQRKRKVSNEDVDDIILKKRKREIRKQSIEKNTTEVQSQDADQGHKGSEIIVKTIIKQEKNLAIENPDRSSVHSNENGKRKEIRQTVTVPKKTEIKPADTIKDSPNSTKEHKHLKTVKDVTQTPNVLKPSLKIPDSAAERHRIKTYMLVPSYHGFKDFSPIVLGSRTRSRKTEPVKTEKEDDVPVTKPPEKSEKDIPLLVIETVGKKAVKQDVVAKNEQLRDFVKNSILKQGMLKQELELNEKNEDAEQFENREKRNLSVNRNTGETVLHKASRMGYDETVYHCIQQGSDSNAKDNAGWTPLHEACSRGHSDVVRVLVKYNADVNACSNDGIRPIHDAADNGKIDSLRLLMAYDADPFISTYSGRSVVDCAKRTEAKDYIKACIGDLYLNDERNTVAGVDHENRWDFRGSSSILDKDRKYLGDIFDNVPKQQSNNSVEFEWSETPHLPTYSLPLVKDGIVVGRKNYIMFHDLQEALNKPRQNVVRLLKRTKIREINLAEFKKEVSSRYFNKLSECPPASEEGKVELVPLNWTVRSLLKIKCEQLAL